MKEVPITLWLFLLAVSVVIVYLSWHILSNNYWRAAMTFLAGAFFAFSLKEYQIQVVE